MDNDKEIILASKSPRRADLLKLIGLKFDVEPSNVNENEKIELSGDLYAEYWSKEKALSLSKGHPDKLIIGADTIVIANGEILGKPSCEDESERMLKVLSGDTHQVVTGVTLFCKSKKIIKTFSATTEVSVMEIPKDKIIYYIDNFNTLDKAGGYGIQDWFSVWIKEIDGCYYNVIGLPISKFYYYYSKIVKDHFL